MDGGGITSEVNNQLTRDSIGIGEFAVSTFRFEYPQWLLALENRDRTLDRIVTQDEQVYDEDGDLVVNRGRERPPQEGQITIEHALSTNLDGEHFTKYYWEI